MIVEIFIESNFFKNSSIFFFFSHYSAHSSASLSFRRSRKEGHSSSTVDPRLRYPEVLASSFDQVNQEGMFVQLSTICTPDVILTSSWINDSQFELKRHREIRGIRQIARFGSFIIMLSPDLLINVKKKILYKNPDGTSFVVANLLGHGTASLSIFVRNALWLAGQRVLSTSGFIPEVFTFQQQRANNAHSLTSSSSSSSCPSSPNSSTSPSTLPGDSKTAVAEEHVGSENEKNNEQEEGDDQSTEDGSFNSVTKNSANAGTLSSQPTGTAGAQMGDPRRKRGSSSTAASFIHRHFFNIRRRKLSLDEVEVLEEESDIQVIKIEKPGMYFVSNVVILHINTDHKVHKIEVFKHLDRKRMKW